MTDKTRAEPVTELRQAVHTYLFYKNQERQAQARLREVYSPGRNAPRSVLVKGILANGDTDPSTGSVVWDFDEPIMMDGRKITGLRWQRAAPLVINEERARALVIDRGVDEALRVPVMRFPGITDDDLARMRDAVTYYGLDMDEDEEWDYGPLYVLNQQGKLTDDELASVLEEDETWSLRVMEATA
jgi:hypothetical protein